jgi:hypothetical protein
MTCADNPTLSQYEPIVEALFTAAWSENGWDLKVNHRHCSGRFGQCGQDQFTNLLLEELEDVLCALVSSWGPFGSATRRLDESSF